MGQAPVVSINSRPEDTQNIGRILGKYSEPGHVFLLVGDLGAGKTCLTQGILWGLGSDEYARSPTFVLVSEYHERLPMYHIDLYRLNNRAEANGLGMDEYLYGEGLCVIEWADKLPSLFLENHLKIQIESLSHNKRRLTLSTMGSNYTRLMKAVRSSLE